MINIVLIYGIIDYSGQLYQITFLNDVHNFVAGFRHLFSDNLPFISGHVRLRSFFGEPGWFGGFIFMNFPLIYKISLAKDKIFKNNSFNKLFVRPLAILAWICVFLSKSPIWLIFCLIQFLIIFRFKIIKKLLNLKYFTIIICSLFLILFGFFIYINNFESKFNLPQFERIQTTIIAILTSFEKFTEDEISLATRIVSYYNLIRLWVTNILFGVGLNNARYELIQIYNTCTIPMTSENILDLQRGLNLGYVVSNTTIILKLLSETGLLGFALFYFHIFMIFKILNNNYLVIHNAIIKNFANGYKGSLIAFIVYNFYDSLISNPYSWFFLGISTAIFIYSNNKQYERLINDINNHSSI